jgi:hypothetical protein
MPAQRAVHNMIHLHANSYAEYTWWLGRWVYRRTVDFSAIVLQ